MKIERSMSQGEYKVLGIVGGRYITVWSPISHASAERALRRYLAGEI